MGLAEYRRKRDFARTSEPRGKRAPRRAKLTFVVQKHAASHLHYDFRLELDGVLKSWAVPKGPDLDPSQKRLAMQVEDHPLEYGKFEGIIPHGEYGGGTVMLWDRGTWEPIGDATKGYREGHLKFVLHGEKLRGGWMLVRRGGKNGNPDERHWFFFKERDEFADPKKSITETKRLSVATGRDLDEIAADSDRVWGSNGESGEENSGKKKPAKAKTAPPAKTASRTKRAQHKARTGEASDGAQMIGGVRLTHPDKVLYPEQGLTKLDLASYYQQVAEWMLPLVVGRPLALVRCPGGRGKPCFFQKHPGEGETKHLSQVDVSLTGTPEYHLAIKNEASLIELVQMGVLEIHVWGALAKRLEKPDRLIFDLDPDPSVAWAQVVAAAREVRLVLEELDLTSFIKTTGGKGLHVVVPIQPRTDWEESRGFCKAVADLIVRAAPDRYIATMSKAARKGKIFIDYLRNGRGATSVAAYSTRSRPDAPVSVPISWDELTAKLHSDHFTISNVLPRLTRLKKDPWESLVTTRQSITQSMRKRLEGLTAPGG
ncbi:MAG TPA: non-homologous end-joining DNA ligase [Pirellulales bacterium]|jgi:bifunctional non-homologous end joining protein LigD|nr:non-homologous end-joining DNA ligase [Pirellulales bacterium]